MRKIAAILVLCLLLIATLFAVALADIPLVNPQQLAIPAIGDAINNLIVQINAQFKATAVQGACPVGVKCVTPTGVAATDTAAIQAAVNTDYAIVLLLPGTFVLNSSINVTHRNVTIEGLTGGMSAGLGGSVPPYPGNTNVDCSALATSGVTGCFTVTNQNAYFRGFHILGNAGSGKNCISAGDSGLLINGRMSLDNCLYGVYIDISVGTTTGFALNPIIEDIIIPYAFQSAVYCNSSCTDYMFGPNINTEVAGANATNGAAFTLGANALQGTIFSNFVDSSFGAPCLLLQSGASLVHFVGNRCMASTGVIATSANNISILDNWFQTPQATGVIQLAGTNTFWTINGNHFPYGHGPSGSSCFQASAGASLSGVMSGNDCNTTPGNGVLTLYADVTSEKVYEPVQLTHPIANQAIGNTAGTFAAPDWQFGFNASLSLAHGSNTLPNPVYISSGQSGYLNFKQTQFGGDTVTCSSQYVGCPNLSSKPTSEIDAVPWTTNNGLIALGTPFAVFPPVNLVTAGGTNFASGWTTSRATITTGQSDPFAGTNAAKIIEDTSNNTHTTTQNITVADNNTYNCSVFLKALGSGSARGIAVTISGATGAAFAVSDDSGNIVNPGVSGTAVSQGNSTTTTLGGGWVQLVIAASSLGSGTGSMTVQLTSGGGGTYLGDGASGQFIYKPYCLAGSAAP